MRHRGFTLVELLVSVALMVILIGSVTFVFVQAQNIYSQTGSNIQVDLNARTVMDIMARDLSNVVKSHEMEFYEDTDSSGHFDNADTRLAGQSMGPLGDTYHHALMVRWGKYTDPDGRERRADTVYFKTVQPVATMVDGKEEQLEAEVLVRYELDHAANPDFPVLRRRSQWAEGPGASGKLTITDGEADADSEVSESICEWVVDFAVEVMVPEPGSASYRPTNMDLSSISAGGNPVFHSYHPSSGPAGGTLVPEKGEFKVEQGDTEALVLKGVASGDPCYLYTSGGKGQALTIKSIQTRGGGTVLTFIEPLTLTDTNLVYRVGFLPPSLRVSLSLKDEQQTQERTIRREFRLPSR
ncbi:MAG: prepilin-type N-terminal cleavage/methylation domain-containing protein [Planctomycetes bacterium]|nr:prepilin-type N-terminal cleavage/methylation domain-containing protein [Planctomycetota bacterium]